MRIVVPLSAGGPTDVLARIVAEAMTPVLGQQVIVENRTGASGQVAVDYVTRAAPDGYTLLMATLGTVILPQTNPGFDAGTLSKLQALAKFEGRPVYIVVPSSLPVKDMAGLIAYAKENPGKVRYAAQGASDILGVGQLAKLSGAELPVVRYQGGTQALQAVVSGQVQFTFGSLGAVKPFMDSGALRLIAVSSKERVPGYPEVGTVAEAVPGFEFVSWTGLAVPTGVPADVMARLHDAVEAALKSPSVTTRFQEMGTTPEPGSAADFDAFFRSEIDRWAEVARSIGFQAQ